MGLTKPVFQDQIRKLQAAKNMRIPLSALEYWLKDLEENGITDTSLPLGVEWAIHREPYRGKWIDAGELSQACELALEATRIGEARARKAEESKPWTIEKQDARKFKAIIGTLDGRYSISGLIKYCLKMEEIEPGVVPESWAEAARSLEEL